MSNVFSNFSNWCVCDVKKWSGPFQNLILFVVLSFPQKTTKRNFCSLICKVVISFLTVPIKRKCIIFFFLSLDCPLRCLQLVIESKVRREFSVNQPSESFSCYMVKKRRCLMSSGMENQSHSLSIGRIIWVVRTGGTCKESPEEDVMGFLTRSFEVGQTR